MRAVMKRALGALGCVCLLSLPPGARAAHAYVSNEDGHTVSVIDIDAARVVATIAVGTRPRGLELSRDGSRLYVAVSGRAKCSRPDAECSKLQHDVSADGIAVVDTHAMKLLQVLRAGSDPVQFALSPEGRLLYATNEDSAGTSVINTSTGAAVTRISVGREPQGARLSPDGAWLLVANHADNSVSIIDTHLLQLARTVPVGRGPRDVAVTPDNRFAYVSGELDASIYRVALPSGNSVARLIRLRAEDHPQGLLLNGPEHRLYVSTGRGGTVAVVALNESRLLAEIPVGGRPRGMALTPNRRLLFTANGSSNDVTIIDTATLRVWQKVPVGRSPWGVVVGP